MWTAAVVEAFQFDSGGMPQPVRTDLLVPLPQPVLSPFCGGPKLLPGVCCYLFFTPTNCARYSFALAGVAKISATCFSISSPET